MIQNRPRPATRFCWWPGLVLLGLAAGCGTVHERTEAQPVKVPFRLTTVPSGAEVYLGLRSADIEDVNKASVGTLVQQGFERLGTSPISTKLIIPGKVRIAEKRTSGGSLIYATRGIPIPERTVRYLLVRLEGWEAVVRPIDLPIFDPLEIQLQPAAMAGSGANDAGGVDAAGSMATETGGTTQVEFESMPEGAEISLDGRFVGCTPAVLDLAPGTYQVLIALPSGPQYAKELAVLGRGHTRVVARFHDE